MSSNVAMGFIRASSSAVRSPEVVQLMMTSQSRRARINLMVSANRAASIVPIPSSSRMWRCTTAAPAFQHL